MTSAPLPQSTTSQRWLARLSFVLAVVAVVIVAVFAGLRSFAMLGVGLVAAAVSLAAAFFFLARRGVVRWLSLAVFVLAPIAVLVVYAIKDLLWVAIASAAAWLLAFVTARAALAGEVTDWRMPEYPAQPPARHPYFIMNPKSGGGKVAKFNLKQRAEDLGAEVFLMDGRSPSMSPTWRAKPSPGALTCSASRAATARRPWWRRRRRAWHPVRGDHRRHAQSLRP